MKNLMEKMEVIKDKIIDDERGQLPELGWQAGALAVVVVVIVAVIAFMPDVILGLIQDVLDWAKEQIGF